MAVIPRCPHLAEGPPFLCAGVANTHYSCFFTHPCFSILCAGTVNTRLYVKLCQNALARAGLAALIFCAHLSSFCPAPCCIFLCAGAANKHFSCFSTHPCFSILCAGAVNTRLYVKLYQNASARASLATVFFCVQVRQIRIVRLFALPLLLSFVRWIV